MKYLRNFTVMCLSLLLSVSIFFPLSRINAASSAVVEDTFFTPLRVGEPSQVYFYFKNTEKKQSKLSAKFTVKEFPKGNEPGWFTQFCYSNICFLDEGVSPKTIRADEKEEMHITIAPYQGKVGEKVRIVLDVWPEINIKNKTSLTFYGIVVDNKEIKLTIGKKIASVKTNEGNPKEITLDAAPFVISGRTLVPLRFIGENLGAEIGWDGKTQKITFTLAQKIVTFWVGKKEALNKIGNNYEKTVSMDAAPIISSSRTFVPVRAVSELLGGEVLYDAPTRVVTIHFPPLPKE